MNLSLKGFAQLVQDMSATLQSSATALVDVSVGSVIRAIFEANASVVLWLQWLTLQVLQTTRASTSAGIDLDSWMADFGLSRLPAAPSAGTVTFSRYSPSLSATIPVGSIVKTNDGTLSFEVVEDTQSSIWQPATTNYVIPSGVTSADLPVVCVTPGSVGNVLQGSVTIIAASLPAVDQVVNSNPLTNGIDAETDESFRARFHGYLASRSRATVMAIQNAIAGVRQGLEFAVLENTGPDGSHQIGAFMVIVDDGTGNPSSDLLSSISNAVNSVRPISTTFTVVPPQVLIVSASMKVEFVSADASMTAIPAIPAIENQIAAYLNKLPIGGNASITRLAQQAYQVGPALVNVSEISLNGGFSDIAPPPRTVIKAGQVAVFVL
jgi:phage-related baseplate assembly protein